MVDPLSPNHRILARGDSGTTQYKGYSTTLDHVARTGTVTLHRCLDPSQDVHLPGVKKRLLLYTDPLVPSGMQHLSDVSPHITHLSARATQVL
jgi:hypothetical protein